jgi:hypothetical protein
MIRMSASRLLYYCLADRRWLRWSAEVVSLFEMFVCLVSSVYLYLLTCCRAHRPAARTLITLLQSCNDFKDPLLFRTTPISLQTQLAMEQTCFAALAWDQT